MATVTNLSASISSISASMSRCTEMLQQMNDILDRMNGVSSASSSPSTASATLASATTAAPPSSAAPPTSAPTTHAGSPPAPVFSSASSSPGIASATPASVTTATPPPTTAPPTSAPSAHAASPAAPVPSVPLASSTSTAALLSLAARPSTILFAMPMTAISPPSTRIFFRLLTPSYLTATKKITKHRSAVGKGIGGAWALSVSRSASSSATPAASTPATPSVASTVPTNASQTTYSAPSSTASASTTPTSTKSVRGNAAQKVFDEMLLRVLAVDCGAMKAALVHHVIAADHSTTPFMVSTPLAALMSSLTAAATSTNTHSDYTSALSLSKLDESVDRRYILIRNSTYGSGLVISYRAADFLEAHKVFLSMSSIVLLWPLPSAKNNKLSMMKFEPLLGWDGYWGSQGMVLESARAMVIEGILLSSLPLKLDSYSKPMVMLNMLAMVFLHVVDIPVRQVQKLIDMQILMEGLICISCHLVAYGNYWDMPIMDAIDYILCQTATVKLQVIQLMCVEYGNSYQFNCKCLVMADLGQYAFPFNVKEYDNLMRNITRPVLLLWCYYRESSFYLNDEIGYFTWNLSVWLACETEECKGRQPMKNEAFVIQILLHRFPASVHSIMLMLQEEPKFSQGKLLASNYGVLEKCDSYCLASTCEVCLQVKLLWFSTLVTMGFQHAVDDPFQQVQKLTDLHVFSLVGGSKIQAKCCWFLPDALVTSLIFGVQSSPWPPSYGLSSVPTILHLANGANHFRSAKWDFTKDHHIGSRYSCSRKYILSFELQFPWPPPESKIRVLQKIQILWAAQNSCNLLQLVPVVWFSTRKQVQFFLEECHNVQQLRLQVIIRFTLQWKKYECKHRWMILGIQALEAPWDPGGIKSGLRASRILSGGECHGPGPQCWASRWDYGLLASEAHSQNRIRE